MNLQTVNGRPLGLALREADKNRPQNLCRVCIHLMQYLLVFRKALIAMIAQGYVDGLELS